MFIFSRSVVRLRRCVVILNVVNNFIIREEEKQATCTKKYLLKMVEPNPFSSFCCGRFASCGHYFKTPFKLPVFFFSLLPPPVGNKGLNFTAQFNTTQQLFYTQSVLWGDIVGNETFSSQRLLKKSSGKKSAT